MIIGILTVCTVFMCSEVVLRRKSILIVLLLAFAERICGCCCCWFCPLWAQSQCCEGATCRIDFSKNDFRMWTASLKQLRCVFFSLIFRVLIENRLTSLYLAKWIWVMKMKKSRYREWLCEREGGNEIKQRGKLAFCIKFEFVCRFDSIRLYIYPPFPMYCFTSKTTDWSLLRSFHTHFAAIFYLFVRMETKYIWKFLVLYYNIGNRVIITGVFFAYVCVCVCYCERTFH